MHQLADFANLSYSGEQTSILARQFLQVIPMGVQYDGLFEVTTATLERPTNCIGLSPTLQRPTLVLNRNWQPINVATVARALIMLWNDSAKIVDPVDYQLYDWSDWSRMVPDRDEPFIQSVRQPASVSSRLEASPKLVNIDLQPYQTVQACERADIMNIGGFSDSVFNVISAFLADNNQRFVAEVEAIEL
jgi:hypothetical protein